VSARDRRRAASSFYAAAIGAADREQLDEARAVEGLADEIALLRLRLRNALAHHADDARLIESGVRLLVQSLLAQRRLSPQQADHLAGAIANILEEVGLIVGGAPDDHAA
jgi:hypothetical protein